MPKPLSHAVRQCKWTDDSAHDSKATPQGIRAAGDARLVDYIAFEKARQALANIEALMQESARMTNTRTMVSSIQTNINYHVDTLTSILSGRAKHDAVPESKLVHSVTILEGASQKPLELVVLQAARPARLKLDFSQLDGSITFMLLSNCGSMLFSFEPSSTLGELIEEIRKHTSTTGIEARQSGEDSFELISKQIGLNAVIEIDLIEGELGQNGHAAVGSDAKATIDGTPVTAFGGLLCHRDHEIALDVQINPECRGSTTLFPSNAVAAERFSREIWPLAYSRQLSILRGGRPDVRASAADADARKLVSDLAVRLRDEIVQQTQVIPFNYGTRLPDATVCGT